MAPALAERQETRNGLVDGATVVTASTVAGAGTFAAGTHIAKNGINFGGLKQAATDAAAKVGDAASQATETVKNIDLKEVANNAKESAKDLASKGFDAVKGAIGKNTPAPEFEQPSLDLGIAEQAKEGVATTAKSFKEKASGVFNSLKDKVGGLKQSFDGIEDPKVKSAIIAAAALATLATAKVAHDKLSETHIDPTQSRIEHVSQGVAKTSELAIPR